MLLAEGETSGGDTMVPGTGDGVLSEEEKPEFVGLRLLMWKEATDVSGREQELEISTPRSHKRMDREESDKTHVCLQPLRWNRTPSRAAEVEVDFEQERYRRRC